MCFRRTKPLAVFAAVSSLTHIAAAGACYSCDRNQTDVDSTMLLAQRFRVKSRTQQTHISCNETNPDQQYLFILSTGRTGSTSVLDMVNAIPGYFLAGENGGILSAFRDLGKKMNQSEPWQGSAAWQSGTKDLALRTCALQAYTQAIIGAEANQAHTIGFKEIRHTSPEELDAFLEIFPRSRYIINIRKDVAAQCKSGFFGQRSEESVKGCPKDIAEKNHNLMTWGSLHSDRVFLLPLEDFTVAKFDEMLHWLGEGRCKYNNVIHANDAGKYSSLARRGSQKQDGVISCTEAPRNDFMQKHILKVPRNDSMQKDILQAVN